MFFKGMQNTFQSQLESPVFEGSKTKISFISQTSLLKVFKTGPLVFLT